MSTIEETFGERLQAIRESRETSPGRKMSREYLAHQAGLTSATIYRWEQGKTDPPFRYVIRLAVALEVSLDYLAGLDGESA
jgi:transcriptional regulator with XRE-family HTH domain